MVSTVPIDLIEQYNRQGYSCLPIQYGATSCQQMISALDKLIKDMANHYHITVDHLLTIINRWPLASLDNPLILCFKQKIAQYLEALFHAQPILVEADIIYKSTLAPRATPCHQDIAYCKHQFYSFSTWVPLMDVYNEDGALQCLPKSHLGEIQPPVDFWQPNFRDAFRLTKQWQGNHKTINMKQGQALLFHSKLWHGSQKNNSDNRRIAITLRWQFGNEHFTIPSAKPVPFGMFNCAQVTKAILGKYLFEKNESMPDAFSQLLLKSILVLKQDRCKNFNKDNALNALKNVYILNDAAHRYKAGDNQGLIYAALWQNLLNYLN